MIFMYQEWKGCRWNRVGRAHPSEQKAVMKQAFTEFILFFHKHHWERLPQPKVKMHVVKYREVLHNIRACCIGVSHNSRQKRAEQTFFISINNMLFFICVKRFTESFLLAIDHSSWQYKHRNSMNTENQRRKMAVQFYWDSLPWQSGPSHIRYCVFFPFTDNTSTLSTEWRKGNQVFRN